MQRLCEVGVGGRFLLLHKLAAGSQPSQTTGLKGVCTGVEDSEKPQNPPTFVWFKKFIFLEGAVETMCMQAIIKRVYL